MVWISQIRVDARDSLIPWSTVRSLYERHRIVHVKRAALGRHRPTRWLGEVKRLAKTHTATTVSREGGAAFESEEPWYASFVVHDAATCAATLRRLPRNGVGMRGVPGVAESEVHHGSHAWIFVGDNSMGTEPLDGRPEHTDALAPHIEGTWHYQISGSKLWRVRECGDNGAPIMIRVARGDVLLIDTRVWRHQASIPAEKEPSISIARDFSYVPRQNEEAFGDVDALLAARPAETGDVLFYESDLPDCELPRSKEDANCAVGEDQEGKLCLVATRRISTGEAFAMAPSSSSEDEEK